MKKAFTLYCLALGGASSLAGVSAVMSPESLPLGHSQTLPRPTSAAVYARQDNDNNNAQIQQLQQQEQQEQQRNSASISSISSSFSSRLNSVSTSMSSSIVQLQTSIQSAQQAINTLQQSANEASRSASDASRSAAAAVASVQSSAASAQSALSASLQSSMAVSVSSAESAMSVSMSSVMVAAVASASSAVVAQAAAATVAAGPTATPVAVQTAIAPAATSTPSEVNGAASAQDQQQLSLVQTGKQANVLGACSTPEVVLAFAGIILGAVGVASLGCVVVLWYWRRRQTRDAYSSDKSNTDKTKGSSGLSGESRSSGGSLRQWRIRASTSGPKAAGGKASSQPAETSEMKFNLAVYGNASTMPNETKANEPAPPMAAPVAASADDRLFSAWSFTTADGGRESTMPVSEPDVVAPLKLSQPRASRNFSRTSRVVGSSVARSAAAMQQPRPTSSVYEPFDRAARAVLRGDNANGMDLDRISRMEDDWNRSQMQRAAPASAAKKPGPSYATNYAYYSSSSNDDNNNVNNINNTYSRTTTSRYASKDSTDSMAREYHAFVSGMAPVSQYGGQPLQKSKTASPSSKSRTQREPIGPPSGPLPGVPQTDSEKFEIRPYMSAELI